MIAGKGNCDDLPPGFRFHPTDEELIMYYLKNQATSKPCPVSIIPEIDIYKFDPWQLPEKAEFGEKEWYFFSPRDRKYPNGVRPNRATVSGYWKATGTDKAIYSGANYVGVKKALVFYKGKPPKGSKTDWIMHEYRLSDSTRKHTIKHINGSMRLDDWVLCRIYKKKPSVGTKQYYMGHEAEFMGGRADRQKITEVEKTTDQLSKTCSVSQLLELDCLGPISHLLNDNYDFGSQNMVGNHNQYSYNTDTNSGMFQAMLMNHNNQGSGLLNQQQPFFVNPTSSPMVYEFQ